MESVQQFIDDPKARDISVSRVFTPEMWGELQMLMKARGWSGIEETDARWRTDFSSRKIIGGFIKDKSLGDKRLASMPDRYTNTINTVRLRTRAPPLLILPPAVASWRRVRPCTCICPGSSASHASRRS